MNNTHAKKPDQHTDANPDSVHECCKKKNTTQPQTHQGHHGSDHSTCHNSSEPVADGDKYNLVPGGFDGIIYTCPMHPEIRQIGPGDCPKCGMALEALVSDSGENEELKVLNRRYENSTMAEIAIWKT